MKKSLTLFLLILTLFLANTTFLSPSPATASTVINDTEFWSVAELIKLEKDIEISSEAKCENDNTCKLAFRDELVASGGQYNAWNIFNTKRFLLTSVNPTSENIRVFYRDTDSLLQLLGIGEWPQKLSEIYLVWLDEDQPNPGSVDWVYSDGRPYTWYALDLKNGINNPGVHPLIAESETGNYPGWFPPNQEVEYSVAGQNLQDAPGIIYYTLHYPPNYYFNSHDYSSCLASPYYEAGKECRLLFGEDGSTIYEPYWPNEATHTIVTSSKKEPTALEESNQIETPSVTDETKILTSKSSSISPAPKTIITRTSNSEPKSNTNTEPVELNQQSDSAPSLTIPASGTITPCTKTVNFPWWLIVLLVLGNILILWWFLPNRPKKQ